MENIERISKEVTSAIHKELLITDVRRFVERITELENDTELEWLDKKALISGAASAFRNMFKVSLDGIARNEVTQ